MGLKTGHSTNYTINKLDFSTLKKLIKNRQLRRAGETGGPVVDFDVSWIIRRSSTMPYDVRIISMIRLAILFISHGCRVFFIFDNNDRHHSKRSTIRRTVDAYQNRIECHFLKCDLTVLSQQQTTTEDEEKQKQTDILAIRKKINSIQKQMSEIVVDVGEKLVTKVQEQIQKLKLDPLYRNIDEVLTCLVAEYQADLVIAYRTANKMNDIVLCSDSDQGVHGWNDCVCVKDYSFKQKHNVSSLENIGIFCPTKKTLEEICDQINLPLDSENINHPKYPILEHQHDIRTRCLIAVGIGCDVYLDGVPTVTAKRIHDIITNAIKKK
jgi:hypothetical protein